MGIKIIPTILKEVLEKCHLNLNYLTSHFKRFHINYDL